MSDRSLSLPSVHLPGVSTPADICSWLVSHGWNSTYDSGGDDKWSKGSLYNGTWEQAVAYEFFLFITLGGRNGKAPT